MDNLRKQAEDLLKFKTENISEMTKFDMQKVIEELQIHQIELQIQNEELRSSRLEIDKSKSKYFNLFDFAPLGYLIIDKTGVILELNLKASEILERRKDYIINHPFVSILEKTSMSKFYTYFESVTNNQNHESFEFKLITKQSAKDIELNISKYIDENYLVVFNDITSRKKSENKLKTNEQKYRNLFEMANDAIFMADAETGIILDANKKAEELLEKSKPEIIGIHQSQLHPKKDENIVKKSFKNDIKNIPKTFSEFYVVTKSLKNIPVEISTTVIEIDEKKIIYGIFRDISERKKAENIIKRSEEKYRMLFENLTTGFVLFKVITDQKNNLIDFIVEECNSNTASLINLEKKQVIGLSLKQISIETFEKIKEQFELGINTKEPFKIETYSEYFNKYFSSMIYFPQDNLVAYIFEDITERITADLKIKDSEEKYRTFVENSMDAFVLTNENGDIIEWNNAQEKITELSKDKTLGKKIWDIQLQMSSSEPKNEINYENFVEIFNNFYKTGKAPFLNNIMEIPILTSSGNSKYVQQLGFSIKTPNGYRLASVARDITKQKYAETQILKAKNLYRKILDEFPAIIWQSGTDKLCHFFNKTWLEFTGRTLEQEYGNGWTEGVHHEDIENCLRIYNNSFDTQQPFEMEYRLRNKTGEYRWIIDFGRPFYDLDDNFAGYLGSCYDITENKLAKTKLQELNDAKDKLFSIIAHDLRSPFSSILGFSDILSKNIRDYDFEKSEKFINIIGSSARSTLYLLDNLLDWAKSQTGQFSFTPENLKLQNVISEIISVLNLTAQIKNISLNNKFTDIEVFADLNMLKTILRNLISNAIKYSKTGGQIDISAEQKNNFTEITISDNGIGMSEENIKDLFKIKGKTSIPGTANEKGSGLGLVLCKEFIEKHKGTIKVESVLNKGSKFKFTIPNIELENLL